jgi:hypothetical protein
MLNPPLSELLALHAQEREELFEIIRVLRADTAHVIYTLDCAMQLIDLLLLFLPHGQALPGDLAGAKQRLDEAMAKIVRRS